MARKTNAELLEIIDERDVEIEQLRSNMSAAELYQRALRQERDTLRARVSVLEHDRLELAKVADRMTSLYLAAINAD